MASLAKPTKKAQRSTKKAPPRPSHADLLTAHLQTEKTNREKRRSRTDNRGSSDSDAEEQIRAEEDESVRKKRKSKKKSKSSRKHVSESESESESDSESDDEDPRSHRHRHRSKKKKTLIPKPFGTSGKKGTGERGSKGYNLKEHMGLADDLAHYLDIRSAVREQVTYHRLTGKKRKQDVKALALICIDVERKYPELKQFENSWPIHDMITGILCNKSDYSKNKVVQRPKKAAQGRARREARKEEADKENDTSDSEQHDGDNTADTGGVGDKEDYDGDQASATDKDEGSELADPEDDTAANENQSGSEDEEDVVDMHWRRTDDLELDSDAQENPLEGVQQGKYLDEDGELTNPMSPGGQTFEESVEMQTQPKIIHKITIPAAKQDTHKKISPLSCSVAVTSGSLSKSLAQSRKAAKTPLATSRTQITSSSSQVINKSQKPIPKRVFTSQPQNITASQTTKAVSRSVKRKPMTPVEA